MVLQRDEAEVREQSVQEHPHWEESPRSPVVIHFASIADSLPPWGWQVEFRDRELRKFWPTEPILASAIYSIVARNAAFSWTLQGDAPRTVKVTQDMLHQADLGKGWLHYITKLTIDIFTTDNGGFTEIIRADNENPASPVLGIAHLDSGQCRRTGVPEWPVVYRDRKGSDHKLKPWQVMTFEEFPSPIETMNGVQLCAVSRVLRMAQLLKDIGMFKREKLSGTNPKAIDIISGISSKEIDDTIQQHTQYQLDRGLIRWIKPLIFGTLDPTAAISHERINLADLPDGFDEETTMRWYITTLAMGFGADYQDLAPLPARGIGSSAQSLVLHMKSRGKGPALFMKTLEHKFNFHGVIPHNITFAYDEMDIAEDMELAEVRKMRADTHKIYGDLGVLTNDAIRQQMLDKGDLTPEVFDSLQETDDITPEVTAHDEERLEPEDIPDKGLKQEEATLNRPDFAEEERLEQEKKLSRDLAKAFQETFDNIKKRLGVKMFGQKQGPEEIANLPDDPRFWTEFRLRAVGAMMPNAREGALKAVAENVKLGLAVDFDLVNAEVLDFSRTFTSAWWQKLEEGTRSGLRKSIVAWQETGLGKEGLPDLAKSIEPLFGKTRARRIATNEVTKIFDQGNLIAHKAAGIEFEEWQTSKDAHVCTLICEPLEGQVFPIDGGPRPVDDTHISCRCARLPVVDGRALGR